MLESDSVVGGISRTARYKDYRFDIGGHRFFTKIAPVQALWEELLGDELIDVPRLSRILYNGKFFNYPLKAGNALAGLGRWQAAIIVAQLRARAHPPASGRGELRAVGVKPLRRPPLPRSFSRRTPRKYGVFPAPRSGRNGRRSEFRGCRWLHAILCGYFAEPASPAIKTLIERIQVSAPRAGADVGALRRASDAARRQCPDESLCYRIRVRRLADSCGQRGHSGWNAPTGSRAFHNYDGASVSCSGARSRSSRRSAQGGRGSHVSGLHPCRADTRPGKSLSRQLDLRAHSGREGRAHPELQQLERGDGTARRSKLPWYGVLRFPRR